MFFGEVEPAAELPPEGEFVAVVRSATERALPWDREKPGLFLGLEFVNAGRVFAFEDVTDCDNVARLATICRACGVQPIGEVDPGDLVGRSIGVEVRRKVSRFGNEFARAGRFFPAPPPKVERRKSASRVVPEPQPGADGLADVPF